MMNVLMPQLGETVTQGTVVAWHKKEGDQVSKDEILADVETDKAAVEIPAPADGVISSVQVQEGETATGGKPNRAEYYAVGIRYQGLNQSGETHSQGTATVYLPSRQGGPVQLPIPHPTPLPYVPYETFYRDWF